VTAARIAYAGARSALVTALESEILRLQVSLSEVNRDERLVRFERLRALVEERRTLPAAPVAKSAPVVLPAPPDGVVVSAEELQELVDETRDHAERVQAQLDQITARVDALRERRRLLRAAVDFHRDDALFAESERNRRVVTGAREGLPTVQGPVRTASTPEDDGSSGRVSPPEGESNDFDGAEAQASPGAPDEASPPAAEGDDGRGAPGSDAPEPERESDSQAGGSDPGSEPSLGSAVSEAPPSLPAVASPHQGGADGLGPGSDRMIRLGDAFDPSTLEGDVDDLSPAGVEQQIRALMARRGVLVEKRTALSSRRKDLERRAVDAQ